MPGRRPIGTGLRRPSNALSDAVRQEVLGLVRTHYPDFGSMQAREKLAAHHEHKLSAETLRAYLAQHGRSIALYSNKHRIFWVNHPDHEGVLTQFTRAFRTLDIEPIHANTPQAKGRVERANNQTLQDRLVKELRLAGTSDIDAANAFLPGFLSDYNLRFAIPPPTRIAPCCTIHKNS